MTDIDRLIRTIGKREFVNWLERCMKSQDTHIMVEKMRSEQPYLGANSCATKISGIYRVIREGLIIEALNEIVEATHVPHAVRAKARNLKNQYAIA
ncbi:MAG: hypothetical protein K0U45_05510 [Alphaproteobacteria bacterium]|nr:hypothetical protein [Alphaproteobacteria bacterium]